MMPGSSRADGVGTRADSWADGWAASWPERAAGQDGGVLRGLLWVVGGLLLAFGTFAALSPELVAAAPAQSLGTVGVVLLAGIPGVVVLLVAAVKRRHVDRDHDVES